MNQQTASRDKYTKNSRRRYQYPLVEPIWRKNQSIRRREATPRRGIRGPILMGCGSDAPSFELVRPYN
ncbi:hypothetical protein SFRURICE_017763 [Spodoptera frugiperda]|nr:hypothetical protein SFRURICE_017763 [Spodoptera frugiperda]